MGKAAILRYNKSSILFNTASILLSQSVSQSVSQYYSYIEESIFKKIAEVSEIIPCFMDLNPKNTIENYMQGHKCLQSLLIST